MLNPEDKGKIQKLIKTHWSIWLAFASAVVLYTVVVFAIFGDRSSEPQDAGMLRQVFVVLSVVLGALKFWMQSRLMFQETTYSKCQILDEIMMKYARYYVIILAICEVPALLGLVLVFLTGQIQEWWLFFIISMALYATATPRGDKLENIAQAHAMRSS